MTPYANGFVGRSANLLIGTAHQLCHNVATQVIENGADLRLLHPDLGHEHLCTTEIYTRMNWGGSKMFAIKPNLG